MAPTVLLPPAPSVDPSPPRTSQLSWGAAGARLLLGWTAGTVTRPPQVAAGWSSQVARRAHNPKVAGLNPAPATNRSEEHTSELQSLMRISYAVFCLKKKNTIKHNTN